MSRKEAILEAAIHLFAERGFSATPTSAVAKKAGVAEGLIFHHFKNKEGIFIHILKEMIDTYIEGIQVITEKTKTGLEAIENIISFHFRFSKENSKEFLVVIRDFPYNLMETGMPGREMIADRSAQVLTLMSKCIARGQSDGSIRELPPEKTASILRGMLNGLSRLQMLGPLPMPDMTTDIVDFCRHGLAR